MSKTSSLSYTKPAIVLHWLVAAIIFVNLVVGLYMDSYPHNSPRFNAVLFYHASLGSLIFVLAALRLGWRLTHTPPALPATVGRWQVIASHAVHGTLYFLMLGVPLTGYVHRMAGGHPVSFFGLGDLPSFVGKNEPLRLLTDTMHRALVFSIVLLVILHVGAALKHRFVNRDGVYERMLG